MDLTRHLPFTWEKSWNAPPLPLCREAEVTRCLVTCKGTALFLNRFHRFVSVPRCRSRHTPCTRNRTLIYCPGQAVRSTCMHVPSLPLTTIKLRCVELSSCPLKRDRKSVV